MLADNAALRALSSFDALENIMGTLTVMDNGVLAFCCGFLSVAEGTLVPIGTPTIAGNASGCNSVDEISNACQASFTIQGDSQIPANVETLTRIRGDLTIDGAITSFPNFAALEVVEGNLVISGITDASLTELKDIFPSLDSIRGDLTLRNDRIEVISGFPELDSVGGAMNVGVLRPNPLGNPALTTLPDFEALRIIGGELCFFENDVLRSIPSFSSLQSVGGGVHIVSNARLTNIPEFDVLTRLGGGLHIENNATLPSVSGFPLLTRVGGTVFIADNALLTDISGFEALTMIVGGLEIGNFSNFREGNPLLASIPSFSLLETIGGSLHIVGSGALTTFPSFESLLHVERDFHVENNAFLTSITGFDELSTILGDVTVRNNPRLSLCCGLFRLVDETVTLGGSITLSGNATGCDSEDEIIANCTDELVFGLPSVVEGRAFLSQSRFQHLICGGNNARNAPSYPHIFWKDFIACYFAPK